MNTKTSTRCHKCLGTGRIGAFAHIDSGKCFTCHGAGVCESETTHVRAISKASTSPVDALRSLYRAGASRTGNARREWAEGISEPFDSYSDLSTLAVARAQVAKLDDSEAAKVRTAFSTLGVTL